MTNKIPTYAGCGACEICGETDPCATCEGTGFANAHKCNIASKNNNGVLKEVNQMLMKIMINHPHFESRGVADLNHKVCEKIRENKKVESVKAGIDFQNKSKWLYQKGG